MSNITDAATQFISTDHTRVFVTIGESAKHKVATPRVNPKFDLETYPNARLVESDEEVTPREEERGTQHLSS